jgi:hypothetical protein
MLNEVCNVSPATAVISSFPEGTTSTAKPVSHLKDTFPPKVVPELEPSLRAAFFGTSGAGQRTFWH